MIRRSKKEVEKEASRHRPQWPGSDILKVTQREPEDSPQSAGADDGEFGSARSQTHIFPSSASSPRKTRFAHQRSTDRKKKTRKKPPGIARNGPIPISWMWRKGSRRIPRKAPVPTMASSGALEAKRISFRPRPRALEKPGSRIKGPPIEKRRRGRSLPASLAMARFQYLGCGAKEAGGFPAKHRCRRWRVRVRLNILLSSASAPSKGNYIG